MDIKDFSVHSVDPVITAALFNEIDSAVKCGDHTGVALYISLLFRQFYNEEKTAVSHITDYGFLINEFFSVHYSENIHLCDLAAELHLSMRQTERLVIKHRGKTFKDSLAETRINMEKYLMNNTDLSLVDIAEYVGYNSYSGLWKTIKKHEDK